VNFPRRRAGTGNALRRRHETNSPEAAAVFDQTIWIPLTVGLGLVAMVLMFAFAEACDRV